MANLNNRVHALEQATDASAELPLHIQVVFVSPDGTKREGPSFNVQRTGHPFERRGNIHIERSYGALKK